MALLSRSSSSRTMSYLRSAIDDRCQQVGPNVSSLAAMEIAGVQMPNAYWELLRLANGFVLDDGLFRVFGTASLDVLPSVLEWNSSEWIRSYGDVFHRVAIIAEDVFGDQYGFADMDGRGPEFVKVLCEGGKHERITA